VSGFPFVVFADTQQPGAPITIGAACADSDGSYLWVTTSKTLWTVQDVAAVPPGTTDPNDWSSYSSFHTSLWAGLPSTPDASAFGNQLAAISSNYFSCTANLFVSLKRTINPSARTQKCQGGAWEADSTMSETVEDDPDWNPPADQGLDLTDASTNPADTSADVDLLNSQPGANTAPVDGYVHQAPPS